MPPTSQSKVPQPKVHKLIQIEKLSAGTENRELCIKCNLYSGCHSAFQQPMVPEDYTGKFLLIGDLQPEYERTGDLFISLGGQVLKRILQQAGVQRKDVAFMPVLRCKPRGTATMGQIRACAPFVYRAIEVLQPRHVIAMGPTAIKSLSNKGSLGAVARLRGRLKTGLHTGEPFGYTVTGSLHQLGTSPNEAARVQEDFERFYKPLLAFPKQGVPNAATYLGFDTEYTPQKVLCGALSDGKTAVTVEATQLSRVAPVLARSTLVGHNLPVDLDALLKAKVSGLKAAMEQWLQGRKQRDTLLLSKLVDENRGQGGYTLEALLVACYNAKDYKASTEAYGPDPTLWPVSLRDERCRLDAWATCKVYEAVKDRTRGPEAIAHAIAMTLQRMRHIGVYVSIEYFRRMKAEIYQEEKQAKAQITKMARKRGMSTFTGTDADVRILVYDKMGLEIETLTKGGLPSASVKVLKEYRKAYPEIEALLAYSKADKLKTTYCDGLEQKFQRQADGRYWLPVNINPLAAKTGRRASASPNWQNQPTRVRQIVVSRFKGGMIADNDYSKLEPIVGGWVTGEHRLTEYFTKYPNGYIKIGKDFFNKEVEKNTKEYTMMKSLVLAILYNKKKWSLADDLWAQGAQLDSDYEKHIDKSGEILGRFLSTLFPGVKAYHQRQEAQVLRSGFVDNAVGQRRRLPLPPDPGRADKIAYKIYMRFKAHVINQAINYPIQSLASYVTGSAMIDLEAAFLRQFKMSYYDFHQALMVKEWPQMPLLCIEVHDDLVLDIPKGMDKKTKEVTHEIMKTVPTLRALLPEFDVPLSVDTNIGKSWGLKS